MSSTAHSPSKDKNLRAGDDEASSLLKRDSGAAADQSSSTTQPSPSITPPTMENPQGATPSPAVPKSTPKSTVIAQAPAPDPNAFIIAEDSSASGEDSDSAFGSGSQSYATSLTSSVTKYTYENGRRYHAYREGQYPMPNDDIEQERLDLTHHVHLLLLDGALHRAPIGQNPQRVLDIGTGTGIWAIQFADEFPSAAVLGTDLSAIQPGWLPPNLQIEIDDAEAEWAYSPDTFDFIHARTLGGSIADWDKLLRQAYDHLKPGGWIELQELEVWLKTDDESFLENSSILEWLHLVEDASTTSGRRMNVAEMHKGALISAGFEYVCDDVYKVPVSPWPKDPKLKELGRWGQAAMLDALEPYSLALLTRHYGWSFERVQVLLIGVRKEILNQKVHAYNNVHFVYGRKPVN